MLSMQEKSRIVNSLFGPGIIGAFHGVAIRDYAILAWARLENNNYHIEVECENVSVLKEDEDLQYVSVVNYEYQHKNSNSLCWAILQCASYILGRQID